MITQWSATPAPAEAPGYDKGIDISHWQIPGNIDWSALAAAGYRWGYCRATYGATIDRHFREHQRRASAAGVPVGAYTFWLPGKGIGAFLAQLTTGYQDLIPTIDIESERERALTPGDWPEILDCVEQVKAHWGECMLYVTQRDWGLLGDPRWPEGCRLWVAHYPARKSSVVDPFTVRPRGPALPRGGPQWSIWQHEGRSALPEPEARRATKGVPIDRNISKGVPLLFQGTGEVLDANVSQGGPAWQ